ncbi:progestin and adipoQ receptor family member 4 isoform X3 [Procambarus clarkii]|uniref:progestin and adipoQ receptor family member 4 isoform X3 n=1 Tax=Procambarus clarkii TaxID=6728 RepID=UPI003743A0F0
MSGKGLGAVSGGGDDGGVADAASVLTQRTLPDTSEQNCSALHNGVVMSGEPHEPGNSSSSSQCSLHVWSKKALLSRKEIPKHLQFNPYIETGYRPLLSAWGCLMSLFYFHNETINIITHGVPMMYILVWWRSLLPWADITVPVLPWTHLVSTVSPWVGSTIYHLFMNHRAGESCYKSLLHLDMFGIWITQSFGALTTVYASVSCLSSAWIWRVLAVYCFVSLWCLYKALTARSAMARRRCFSLAVVMQLFVFYLRSTPFGGGDPHAVIHYVMQASHRPPPPTHPSHATPAWCFS